MCELSSIVDSLLVINDERESNINALYSIIIGRAYLNDAEKRMIVTNAVFSKLSILVARVDEMLVLETNSFLRTGMLACLIIKKLCSNHIPGQILARKTNLLQKLESVTRRVAAATNECNDASKYPQLKAAFMAFSECLISLVDNPPNAENMALVSPNADLYLFYLLNWRIQKSSDVLDRLFQLYNTLVQGSLENSRCPIKSSKSFRDMLRDEVERQRVPRSFDFQLLYWRFAIIAEYPSCLEDLDIETKEALMRRFLLLLETSRDYISYRVAILGFADKVMPYLVARSALVGLDRRSTAISDFDEEEVRTIQKLAQLLRNTLDKNQKSIPKSDIIPSPTKGSLKPNNIKTCDCFSKLMQPGYLDILVRAGVRLLKADS